MLQPHEKNVAFDVSKSIERANRLLPGHHKCLVQAIAANWMLKKRKVSNTVYFGVKSQSDDKKFTAHAWVRSGDTIVTGESGSNEFSIIATFAQD